MTRMPLSSTEDNALSSTEDVLASTDKTPSLSYLPTENGPDAAELVAAS